MGVIMENVAKDVLGVISSTWPIIVLTAIISIVLRVSYIIKNKKKFDFPKELISLIFIIYILCLFQIVTSSDVSGEHGINFTILKEITRYNLKSHLFYRNVIGNIVMFIPFGFFTSYYLNLDKKRYNLLITFFIALTIEVIQLNIGRAFDVDDIILNSIGSFLGYIIYRLIVILCKNKSEKIKGTILIGIMIAMGLLLGLILI